MSSKVPLLPALRDLAAEQSKLLLVALRVASEGSANFEGGVLTCSLGDPQRRTSTMLAMTAGQSASTALELCNSRGIRVRDIYPIARSAVEAFINATYLLSEKPEVAERALRHISYANWRHTNRIVGNGEFSLEIQTEGSSASKAEELFPEFAAKGKSKNWTHLDVPSRISRIGEIAGKCAGNRLLAAYALIYSLSSEIIHGSLFGASFFFGLHRPDGESLDTFLDRTEEQAEDIAISIMHATAGYLYAFFSMQGHAAAVNEELRLFNQLTSIASADEETGKPRRVKVSRPTQPETRK